jgi:protein translocase SecG subunit
MNISIIQIILSVILIVLILLQERSAGLSGIFGGEGGGYYQTRRGLERFIFAATIVGSIAFVVLAVTKLIFA